MSEQDYNVNFFKPKTPHAKANMKVVIGMLLLWGTAVFGFQVLLMLTNKPTPEPTLAKFKEVWSAIKTEKATTDEQKQFARVILMVLGKNLAVKDAHKEILKNALAVTIKQLTADRQVSPADAIGLGNDGFDPLMASILASSTVKSPPAGISEEMAARIEKIMELYLIHNRSSITDTVFLGFPFHYWYTAQFLLIMFVGLCWLYCFLTDRSNTKYNLETEEEVTTTESAPETTPPPGEDATPGKATASDSTTDTPATGTPVGNE